MCFNTYTKNYGELDDNNGDRQRKCTIIPGREIPFLLEDGGITELLPFIDFVRNYSGNKMKIEWIDILETVVRYKWWERIVVFIASRS